MAKNKAFIIFLCILLCIALGVLMYFERKYPEAGSEMMRGLLSRMK